MNVEIQLNKQEIEESLDMIISKLEKANSLADELASKTKSNKEIKFDGKTIFHQENHD